MLPPRVQLTSSAMLKSLEYAENAMEESALEYYENSNLVWRADFTDPTLACTSIGNEFQSRKYGSTEKSSRYSTNGDTDSENQQNGNAALTGILEILPEIASDFENVVPLTALTPH